MTGTPPHPTCLKCETVSSEKIRRTFLGFQKFRCLKCGTVSLYPLSARTRTSYQAIGLLFLLAAVGWLLTDRIPVPGLITIVAAVALWKDRNVRRVTQALPEKGSESWLHGMRAHLKVRLPFVLAVLALLGIGGWEWGHDEPPERAARAFAEARIHDDTTHVYGMLSRADTLAVSRTNFGMGLSPSYSPSYDPWQPMFDQRTTDRVIFDSTRVVMRTDTAAVVEVFLRGPDFGRARARMHSSSYSPDASAASQRAEAAAFKDSYLTAVASLPLRPFVDTVRLIRERGTWRVWLALGMREQLMELRNKFESADLLSQRAILATKFLTFAASVPGVVADTDLAEAQAVVQWKSIADSLRFRMVVLSSAMSRITGETEVAGIIYNLSHVGVKTVSLRVADASGATVELVPGDAGTPPYVWGGSVSAQDNTLFRALAVGKLSGPIVRVDVMDLETW